MTTKLVKCASNHREIIKLGLSDGRRVKFLASMLGVVHDSLRYKCHLGNGGSIFMGQSCWQRRWSSLSNRPDVADKFATNGIVNHRSRIARSTRY